MPPPSVCDACSCVVDVQLLGGSFYLFKLEPTLACVTLVGVTAMGLLTAVHGAFIRRMGRRSQVRRAHTTTWVFA